MAPITITRSSRVTSPRVSRESATGRSCVHAPIAQCAAILVAKGHYRVALRRLERLTTLPSTVIAARASNLADVLG